MIAGIAKLADAKPDRRIETRLRALALKLGLRNELLCLGQPDVECCAGIDLGRRRPRIADDEIGGGRGNAKKRRKGSARGQLIGFGTAKLCLGLN